MTTENSPLRVLMVAARYLPYMGGLETHVHEVGRRLARAGVEVTILTTDVSGQLPAVEELEGIRIHRVPAWPANKDYYFAPDIYRFITREHWDLVHCHSYHNLVAPVAMLAAQHANIPYILTFHSGGDVSRLRTILRGTQWKMLRPLLSHARKLIAVSEFEAGFFQKRLRLPPDQFMVIPNGAHLFEMQTPTIKVVDEGGSEPLIVSIGRLERYKGHQRVIASLPKVLEALPDARLCIAGAGPYEPTLWKIARRYGVARRVEIKVIPPGDRSAMASLITKASLVTLLSEYESQGIAVLEALALRRPVLVAGTSALQEFADQGFALAVPLKSTPAEVAGAMLRQLRQPLPPLNIELPTWDDCAATLLSLYQMITQKVSCGAS
jgi:glycosyltransferase involved in cell wall biosynthesis